MHSRIQEISVYFWNCTCHVLIAADVFIKRLMTSAREDCSGADGHSAICRIEKHLLSQPSHYKNQKMLESARLWPTLNPLWLKVHAGTLAYRCTYTPTHIYTLDRNYPLCQTPVVHHCQCSRRTSLCSTVHMPNDFEGVWVSFFFADDYSE